MAEQANAQPIGIIEDCQIAPTKDQPVEYTNSDNITYRVFNIRVGYAFPMNLELDTPEEGSTWLLVKYQIVNKSSSSVNADSDNFHILADGEEFDEDGSKSANLSNILDLGNMGSTFGSTISAGDQEVFIMPFEVTATASSYAFVIEEENNFQQSLDGLLDQCRMEAEAAARVTPTVTPPPTETPVVTPTKVPTKALTVPVEVPVGTNQKTIDIFNNASRYEGQRVTVKGQIYEIIFDGTQTILYIGDDASDDVITYGFIVIYEGELPGIDKGDVVTITGVLVIPNPGTPPSIFAERVTED